MRWVDEAELTRRIPFHRNFVIFQGLLEIKPAALIKVKEQGLDDGYPGAGMLPAMIMLIAGLPGR